jgi:hypothetical protein
VVTIGTPHRGTWLANFAHLGLNARQMKPGGAWLSALEAAEPPSRRQLFHCIYGHGDNIVFPASNALLPGAREQHVAGTAHIELVHRPEVMAVLWQALGVPAP